MLFRSRVFASPAKHAYDPLFEWTVALGQTGRSTCCLLCSPPQSTVRKVSRQNQLLLPISVTSGQWRQQNKRSCPLTHVLFHHSPNPRKPHPFCSLLSHRFKNVMFDISPSEEVGDFEVKAKFMGVEMEKVQLHFQVKHFCTLRQISP